jgi:hypothetical protein
LAFVEKDDLKQLYSESKTEAKIWKEDYPAYERLANNDLMDGLDSNLPEVNDGSLAAALFKLPKRIVSSRLSGTVKALDRDDQWLSELANLQWRNVIIPNANSQAPFIRKWKDAVRKAGIYGSVPLITLFLERDGKSITDFIVAQPQDVILEKGKVSDYDSDIMFWEVFYSKLQVQQMIEQAKAEQKTEKAEGKAGYNKWDIQALEDIIRGEAEEEREPGDNPKQEDEKKHKSGYKFCIAVQRGVEAPFYMYHAGFDKTVREWSNPDPTGDVPIHYLYCYQDFINPYGIGIVKLAGGTQNVLDYMRQADVLATQIGLRPPIAIQGDPDEVDLESIVYAQDALWFTGKAKVERQELSNQIYQQLPERMSMYKTSLNQLIPTGDTSIQAGAGDPQYSKTPAGVKFQQASLSIDDEDFKDNLYLTYAAKAKSMINTHFANMEGTDLVRLSEEEREILTKAGIEFPTGEDGEPTSQLEIVWDTVRAEFDFEVDPEQDKATADEQKLEGLSKVAELATADPTLVADLAAAGKKFNKGELYSEIIKLTSDNDKIITDINPEEQQGTEAEVAQAGAAAAAGGAKQPKTPEETLNYKDAPDQIKRQIEERAGFAPADALTPEQEKLELEKTKLMSDSQLRVAELEHNVNQTEHSKNMDIVREHNSPDPMEMARMKADTKPKVAA